MDDPSTATTYRISSLSLADESPNNLLMLFRFSVTVTVTIAPAVTTFVFSSSMTAIRKGFLNYSQKKCVQSLNRQLTFTTMTEINEWHSTQHLHQIIPFKVGQMFHNFSRFIFTQFSQLL